MGNGRRGKAPWLVTVEDGLRTTREWLETNSEAALVPHAADTPPELRPESTEITNLTRYKFVSKDITGDKGEIVDVEGITLNKPWLYKQPNALHEEMIGGVMGQEAELYYPNISSCLGVLCVLRDRITGMHLTVASVEKRVDQLLELLVTELNERQRVRALYFFGPVVDWENKQGASDKKLSNRGGFGAMAYLKSRLGFRDRALLAWQERTTTAYYRATRKQDRTSPGVELARASAEAGPYDTLDMASTIRDGDKTRPVFELI